MSADLSPEEDAVPDYAAYFDGVAPGRTTEGGHPPIPQPVWLDLLRKRFGPDPHDWAFVCPACGDVATGTDFERALARNPRTHPSRHGHGGDPVVFGDIIGQECIGRSLGALAAETPEAYKAHGGRGCTWVAYGLIPGPIGVMVAGHEIRVFQAAPARPVLPGEEVIES